MIPKGIASLLHSRSHLHRQPGFSVSGREYLQHSWAGYFSLFPDYRIDIEVAASQNAIYSACRSASPSSRTIEKIVASSSRWRAVRKGWTDCRVADLDADNKTVYELL